MLTKTTEIRRPWWYRLFRSAGGFVYSFWWLAWLIFIAYLVIWYFFCFRQPAFRCATNEEVANRIAAIKRLSDSCCDCVAIPKNELVKTLPPGVKPCDYDEAMNGGKGFFETTHELGPNPGTVLISYNMQDIPDQMDVYYDGQLVATTGNLVRGDGSLSFYYKAEAGRPTSCKVVLKAPAGGTVWDYRINCPR